MVTEDLALKKRMDFLEQELLRLTSERASRENPLAASPGIMNSPSLNVAKAAEELRREYPSSLEARQHGENRLDIANYSTQGSYSTSPAHSAPIPSSNSASTQIQLDPRVGDVRQVSVDATPQYGPTKWIRTVEEHTASNNFYTPPCSHSFHGKDSGMMVDVGQGSTAYSGTDVRQIAFCICAAC